MKKNKADNQLILFNIKPVPTASNLNGQKATNDNSFDLTDALQAPVITANPMWTDTIPERLLKNLSVARLVALKKGEQLASYLECNIYLYTASLEAPMTSEWADITTHVACKVMEDLFNEDHWQTLEAPKELDNYHMSKLNDLRRSIYTKRRELLKKSLKEQLRNQKIASPL